MIKTLSFAELGGVPTTKVGTVMTVADLVAQLQTLPQDAEVWSGFACDDGYGAVLTTQLVSHNNVVYLISDESELPEGDSI
jgi:hypothetical protein